MRKKLIRPGDVIRIHGHANWEEYSGKEFVVVKCGYQDGGTGYSTSSFAWVQDEDCDYVRRATDKEFIKAIDQSNRPDE